MVVFYSKEAFWCCEVVFLPSPFSSQLPNQDVSWPAVGALQRYHSTHRAPGHDPTTGGAAATCPRSHHAHQEREKETQKTETVSEKPQEKLYLELVAGMKDYM